MKSAENPIMHRVDGLSLFRLSLVLAAFVFLQADIGAQQQPPKTTPANSSQTRQDNSARKTSSFDGRGELSWEMPGRLSIYDLQLGSAAFDEGDWKFLGASRTFNAGL